MPDYTLRRISEMETRYGGSFKLARAELGVTSFGMHALDFPPHADRHPPSTTIAATGRRRST